MSRTGVVVLAGNPTVCTGNDTFINNGNQLLVIRNNGAAGGDINVYLKIFPETDGNTVLKKVIFAGDQSIVILDKLPPQIYSDPVTGLANITIQAGQPVNSITFMVLKLGVN